MYGRIARRAITRRGSRAVDDDRLCEKSPNVVGFASPCCYHHYFYCHFRTDSLSAHIRSSPRTVVRRSNRLINFPITILWFSEKGSDVEHDASVRTQYLYRCINYNILTVYVQRDSLANSRRYIVGRYAQIMSHLTAVYFVERQRFSAHPVHCSTHKHIMNNRTTHLVKSL